MNLKLPLIEVPQPKPGTWGYKFCKWFSDTFVFCHGEYYGTDIPKPENKVYNIIYKYWTWPFVNPGCECCSAVRGLIYGSILGFILGGLLL